MKNLSIALNVLLLLAVGYLYYYNFSGSKSSRASDKTNEPLVAKDSNCNRAHIAYVELDSLYANILYIKQRKAQLEEKQKNIETEWENGMKGLEARKNEFLKKGAAITQEEAQNFQAKLIADQQQIDGRRQTLSQDLNEESFKFSEDLQKKLKDFLTEYNKEKKYMYILTTGTGLDYLVYKDPALNITPDVVKGMNELMKVKPSQAKN